MGKLLERLEKLCKFVRLGKENKTNIQSVMLRFHSTKIMIYQNDDSYTEFYKNLK